MRTLGGRCGYQNRDNPECVTSLVEVFQVQGIVPYLLQIRALIGFCAHLVFEDDDDVLD